MSNVTFYLVTPPSSTVKQFDSPWRILIFIFGQNVILFRVEYTEKLVKNDENQTQTHTHT